MIKRELIQNLDSFDAVVEHMAKVHEVVKRWRSGRGEDSAFIALAVRLPEAVVCEIIAADQDRRYAARIATA